jgi:hypothetical protein
MKTSLQNTKGGILVTAVLLIAVVTLVIAAFYEGLMPKYRSVYQGASWQESLQGAEAGADYTIQVMNGYAARTKNAFGYTWPGWTLTDSTAPSATPNPSGGTISSLANRERTLNSDLLPVLGGTNNVRVHKVAVDVYTRNNTSPNTNNTAYPWFRIRSTGRADLPGKTVSSDRRDIALRRMNLNKASPYVARTVEVIVRPKFRFARAITSIDDMTLGTSSNWQVDSFDSSDAAKSDPGNFVGGITVGGINVGGVTAGGVYPVSNPAEIQSNGGIATKNTLPDGTLYGPLINANGSTVLGDVQTIGGDDPNTTTHENVSGSTGMNQSRIRADFEEDIEAMTKPDTSGYIAAPTGSSSVFTASGTPDAPTRYVVNGKLGDFTVAGTGFIEIVVNGNLDIGSGTKAQIVIPPNVYCTIYVDGNIAFNNGMVNSNSDSSQVASHLSIYGVHSTGTYTVSGNSVAIFSLFAPNYDATLNGTDETIGSFVVNKFTISGGGSGSFHYDEALGKGADISGWIVAGYMDDSRADLQ